ncbi:MAG TPA: YoaK family protein [Alphaproteobacteria bacterium]
MSAPAERLTAGVSAPSVDSSLAIKLLPTLLSVIAGSVDAIGFLGLGGLFTAHVTGNLVMLAAHLVGGGEAPAAPMLSVPVFMVALGLTRLLVGGLERIGLASLRPLLLLQLLLLAGFLVLGISAGPSVDPDATNAILAGMLGVSAMAVQNALAQISLKGAPSTAVMTTNITRFMMDVGGVLLGREPAGVAQARRRAMRTWPAIVGFAVGCGLGAAGEAAIGLKSLVLPTGLALLAFAMGLSADLDGGQGS